MAWQRRSIVSGNLSCHARKERAILGVSATEIVIAVFVNGLDVRPEVLRYSGKARNPKTAELKIEDLDYDPKEMIGSDLDGFQRSKSCKGLNLSDGETDSAHITYRQMESACLAHEVGIAREPPALAARLSTSGGRRLLRTAALESPARWMTEPRRKHRPEGSL